MLRHTKHRIHFVGIGGIGMSGIAQILLNLGYRVSGSDLRESEATQRLRAAGAQIFIGHQEENLAGEPTVVVISTAVKYSNPEVLEARRRQIPVIPRAEMLAELMRMKYGVAVAGSHGKTTTTSMISAVLSAAGLDPTTVVGGRVHMLGSNARMGQGEFMVAEADESDGSFLFLSPTIAVVTNIDREHLDYHRSMERLNESFLAFANKVPFYGVAVLCLDDPQVRALLPKVRKRVVTYGLSPEAEFSATDLRSRPGGVEFVAQHRGHRLGSVRLQLPGRHTVSNALAALAVGRELEIPFARAAEALESFSGIHRRFEIKGEPQGVLVIDDYGHHPTEARATIDAIRESWKRPLTVVFQPHRYTRTADLFDEFLTAFDGADRLILTEIYPAGEEPIPEITGEALYQAIRRRGHMDVQFIADKEAIVESLERSLRPGDVALTLGAGDVYQVAEALVARLQPRAAAGGRSGEK
ncbi:MAG TPA: UDP-N-acetylmuramate--L-alanine ligase [candidate division Zixibacteria bacterium]|nr:UDP-N-acetylmuramate--L-alanine ligase [candidate division Zixibacteria bacterium]